MNKIEKSLIIDVDNNIEYALKKLRQTRKRCLIVTKNKKLFGTITDGDLRQFILKKKKLNYKS